MKAFILYIKEPNSLKYAKECAESCVKHGIKYELVEGFFGKTYTELMTSELKYPLVPYDDPHSEWGRHGNVIYGHLKILKNIVELNTPCAILEHDCIVKRDFTNLQLPDDNSIYYLSVKVYNRDDYTPPEDEFTFTKFPVGFNFDGNNAHIIPPKAAKSLLDYYASIVNYYDCCKIYNTKEFSQYIIDPIPVLNECGDRISTVKNSQSGVNNFYIPRSFYKNLTDKSLMNHYMRSTYK